MKILQVCPRYSPYMGGVERVVKNVAEYLVKQNHQVTVYSTDPSKRLPEVRTVKGVNVRRYFALAPNENYHLPHPKMLMHLLGEQCDVTHIHSVHDLTALTAHMSHKLSANSALVISPYYHGKGHTRLTQVLWITYRSVVREILKDANAIIVNSKAEKDVIDRAFRPSCQTFVVYDGISLNEIKNAEPFTFNAENKILLYVGRLERYKNIHVAISSLKFLPENYQFYIIGSGPFKPFLQDLVGSNGLWKRVHFLGFQPDVDVYRWLKTADVFLLLSEVESFGMTCIESLAASTPVIANDDGLGLSETISLYPDQIMVHKIDEESESRLAKLIIEAAELKPVRADVSRFAWDKIARSICEVYLQVL